MKEGEQNLFKDNFTRRRFLTQAIGSGIAMTAGLIDGEIVFQKRQRIEKDVEDKLKKQGIFYADSQKREQAHRTLRGTEEYKLQHKDEVEKAQETVTQDQRFWSAHKEGLDARKDYPSDTRMNFDLGVVYGGLVGATLAIGEAIAKLWVNGDKQI